MNVTDIRCWHLPAQTNGIVFILVVPKYYILILCKLKLYLRQNAKLKYDLYQYGLTLN